MMLKLFSRNGKGGDNTVLTPDEIKAAAKADPNSFGNLAVELGFITPADLEDALARQHARIGDLLVQSNKITAEQRDALVLEQRYRRGEKLRTEELQKLERVKFRRGVRALADGFKDAAADAGALAASVTALTIKG